MNRDDIIRMAQKAAEETGTLVPTEWNDPLLERFAALVAAHAKTDQINLAYQQGYEAGSADEREACAKVCEGWYASLNVAQDGYAKYGVPAVAACAADIRARGETECKGMRWEHTVVVWTAPQSERGKK